MATLEPLELKESKYEPGTYFLGAETWKVGPKYKLEKYLGSGSFSSVCLALDTETGMKVALKKISNVASNPDNARKVLRELCILRRLSHPHVIKLHNAFWKDSPTGRFTLVNGTLQSSSIDVYLALEYCDGGDLHALKGQLSSTQIQNLMNQLLAGVSYMHELNVWHRDLKSANVLLRVHEGQYMAAIADLGSARSGAGNTSIQQLKRAESIISEPAGVSMTVSKLLKRQAEQPQLLTTKVCTPCYRAPEVVIARGKYTSAMDMWSLGCIFGELLQRMERAGASFTPKLTIMPVFQFSNWSPPTPVPGSTYQDGVLAGKELQAIFEVIGSPEWSCIEAVESEAWRRFLWQVPATAPHLHRRFGFAGEPAVDLLRRLLAFDPNRRCRADEALSHEYFHEESEAASAASPHSSPTAIITSLPPHKTIDTSGATDSDPPSPPAPPPSQFTKCPEPTAASSSHATGTSPHTTLGHPPAQPTQFPSEPAPPAGRARSASAGASSMSHVNTHRTSGARQQSSAAEGAPPNSRSSTGFSGVPRQRTGLRLADFSGASVGNCDAVKRRRSHMSSQESHGDMERDSAPPCNASLECHASSNPSGEVKAVRRQTLHYFDIVEPAAALEYLELELDRLIEQGVSTVQEVGEAEARSALMVTCQALCTLIKQECEAEADRQAEIIHECGEQCMDEDTTGSEAFQRRWWGRHQPLEPDPRNIVTSTVTAVEETATGSSLRRLSLADLDPNGGRGLLKVSRSPRYMTQDDDSEQNKRLPFKAEDQLRPGRHDEWSLFTGHAFTTPAGPSWGGGMGDMDVDDRTREMIYRQQQR